MLLTGDAEKAKAASAANAAAVLGPQQGWPKGETSTTPSPSWAHGWPLQSGVAMWPDDCAIPMDRRRVPPPSQAGPLKTAPPAALPFPCRGPTGTAEPQDGRGWCSRAPVCKAPPTPSHEQEMNCCGQATEVVSFTSYSSRCDPNRHPHWIHGGRRPTQQRAARTTRLCFRVKFSSSYKHQLFSQGAGDHDEKTNACEHS